MLSGSNDALQFTKEYIGSTANVIKSVLLQKADAGATFNTELDKEAPEVRAQLRTILKTRDIPSHPLAAHPRVAQPVRNAVQGAILTLAATDTGAKLLGGLRLTAPVAADYQRDYRPLDEVEVKKLSAWGE